MSVADKLVEKIRSLNKDIHIRTAQARDAGPFTELMNGQYRRKKSEAYFHWRFINNVDPTALFVAYHNDVLAGCYGVQMRRLSNGALCGFTLDLLVGEAYRNRGLFVLLEAAAHQWAVEHGAALMAVLPNSSGMLAHRSLGSWWPVGRMYAFRWTAFAKKHDDAPSFRTPAGPVVFFKKDPAYRRWRFAENPECRYTEVRAAGGAFAVTKIFTDPATGVRIGDIVDFEGDLSDPLGLRDVFRQACAYLHGHSVEAVMTWALPSTPLPDVLASLGFVEDSQERYFCLKALDPSYRDWVAPERWHLVPADSEVF